MVGSMSHSNHFGQLAPRDGPNGTAALDSMSHSDHFGQLAPRQDDLRHLGTESNGRQT